MASIDSNIPLPTDQESWDYLRESVAEEIRVYLPEEFSFDDAQAVLDFFDDEQIIIPHKWRKEAADLAGKSVVGNPDASLWTAQLRPQGGSFVEQQPGVGAQIPVPSLASQTSRELNLRLEVFKTRVADDYYGKSIKKTHNQLMFAEDYQGHSVSGYAVELFEVFQNIVVRIPADHHTFYNAQNAVADVLRQHCLSSDPDMSQTSRDIVLFFLNEINKRTGGIETGWEYSLLRGFYHYTNPEQAQRMEVIQGQTMMESAAEYLCQNRGANDVKGVVVAAFDVSSLSTDLKEHLISVEDNLQQAAARVRFMNTNLEIASFIKTFEGNRDDVEWIYTQLGIPQDSASGEFLIDEIYSQMGILSANEWLTITADEAMQRNFHESSYPVSSDVWKYCFELARAKKMLDVKQYAFMAFAVAGSIAAVIGGTAVAGPAGGMVAGAAVAGLTGGYDVYQTHERLTAVETANVAQRLAGFPLGDDAYVDLVREEYYYSIGAAVGNTALAAAGGYANQFITGSRLTRITLQGLYGAVDGAGSWSLDGRQSNLDYLERSLGMSGGNPDAARLVAIKGLVFSVGVGLGAGAGAEVVFGGAGRARAPVSGDERVHVVTKFDGSAELVDPLSNRRLPVTLQKTDTGISAKLPDGRVIPLDIQDQQMVGVVRGGQAQESLAAHIDGDTGSSQRVAQTGENSGDTSARTKGDGRDEVGAAIYSEAPAEARRAAQAEGPSDVVSAPILPEVPTTRVLDGAEIARLSQSPIPSEIELYGAVILYRSDPEIFWRAVEQGDLSARELCDTYGLKRTVELPEVNPAARPRAEREVEEPPQQALYAEVAAEGTVGRKSAVREQGADMMAAEGTGTHGVETVRQFPDIDGLDAQVSRLPTLLSEIRNLKATYPELFEGYSLFSRKVQKLTDQALVARSAKDVASLEKAITDITIEITEIKRKLLQSRAARTQPLETAEVQTQQAKPEHTFSVGQDGTRTYNCSKTDSPAWQLLEHHGGTYKRSGSGKSRRYYYWDHLHNDIEVVDRLGGHVGSLDPFTGEMYKGPNPKHKRVTIE